MTYRATPKWLWGFRVAGWLLAPLPLVAASSVLWNVWMDKQASAEEAEQNWRAAVARIRVCRTAAQGPMIDWRLCEDEVLARDWRSSQPAGANLRRR